MKLIKLLLVQLFLCVYLAGCGIGHYLVEMPLLDIVVSTSNSNESLLVVAPDFYGESHAFSLLVSGRLEYESTYYSFSEMNLTPGSSKSMLVDEKSRYIGTMLPFTPSNDSLQRRVIFIKRDKTIYKLSIRGSSIKIHTTDFDECKVALPETIANDTWSDKLRLRRDQIAEEIEFYQNIEWDDSNDGLSAHRSRSTVLDKVEIML